MKMEMKILNSLIKIGNGTVVPKQYRGKRVVTFAEIDACHGRPEGTAKRNFSDNRQHFVNGTDYFEITHKDVGTNFVRTYGFGNKAPKGIIITETGYLMLAKSLTDDLAWDVQRELVSYFEDGKGISDKSSAKSAKPKKFSLASFNHLLEINIRQMKAAAEPATRIASWTNGMTRDVLSPFGINVPALPDAVPTTYDATEMAKKLGVYSKSGNPHPQPITAIIKEVGLAPGETFTTETTAHGGRKDVPDVRYAESVLDKVHKWLDAAGWPNPIILGRKYNVVYKERNQS